MEGKPEEQFKGQPLMLATNMENPHSVKFSVNAKGAYSAEVKCYGATPEQALKKACEITMNVEKIIKEKNHLE